MTFLELLWFGDWIVSSSSFLAFIIAILFLENDKYFSTFLTFTMYIAILEAFTPVGFFDWVLDNPRTILIWSIGYVALGVLYSFLKWWSFLREVGDCLAEGKKLCANSPSCEWNKEKANDYIHEEFGYNVALYQLKARYQKSRISAWIFYWPLSMVGFFINDPLRRLGEFLINSLNDFYSSITKRTITKHVDEDWLE